MRSQVSFAMHPDDEREFEQVLLRDESIRFIAGPRWKTETPDTSRSLEDIGYFCIIWSTSDIKKLKADYISSCDDWYCQSEYATIQFLRSKIEDEILIDGRLAISTISSRDFPLSSVKSLEKRYGDLRKYFRKTYSNSIVQWRNPTLPYAPASPNHSPNPGKPDPLLWVGPHALRWLRERPDRRIKPFRDANVEALLVDMS